MNKMANEQESIRRILLHQLSSYWDDINENVIDDALPGAFEAIEKNFHNLPGSRYFDGTDVLFSPYFSIHWMIFLYRLAHEIYSRGSGNTPKEADQIYYLNKIMHSNDWFYGINLPDHFLCEHPLGSVLGRAQYGDYLFIYQGTTVGGSRRGEKLYYPVLGDNVILFANASVLGNSQIGNNVVISSGTRIVNQNVPDNCIVFGSSPNLEIKIKTEQEIKKYTEHIWGWSR